MIAGSWNCIIGDVSLRDWIWFPVVCDKLRGVCDAVWLCGTVS